MLTSWQIVDFVKSKGKSKPLDNDDLLKETDYTKKMASVIDLFLSLGLTPKTSNILPNNLYCCTGSHIITFKNDAFYIEGPNLGLQFTGKCPTVQDFRDTIAKIQNRNLVGNWSFNRGFTFFAV